VTVGPFRLLEKIGEGGMGEVYLADQTSPVRRRVALKLIKLGMDTKEVVARFESERQALALLNHPNIAHVFDAGSTPDGRPYFAMEFVQGLSIRDYCTRERLTVPERLRLFIQACEGVQHAHQKGIIHRDLKPSNLLVALQDGKPVPKIIDFGIAKATSQRLTESTLHTAVGHLVGTPAYMSPEQADYTLLDIDTRTDVYSLGAVLYELLTGELPLDQRAARVQGYEEIIRTIREVEPVRPSTRVTTGVVGAAPGAAEAAAVTARAFRADAASLARDLRGDLDWIVLKALEKDRTRRYDSASELAADIERHLNNEPVLASPPSTSYRVRKFVRRHRVGVAAGVAVGLALIAGIVGTSVGLVRAREAERMARAAEHKAREEAETATEVTDLMVDVFRTSDPSQVGLGQSTASSETRGSKITAREVLDKGAQRIQQRLVDKPVVRGRLMDVIGNAYSNLGLRATAEPILREVLMMREATFGPNSPEVATSLMSLASVEGNEEKISMYRRALGIRQRVLGRHDIQTAWSQYFLGQTLLLTQRFTEAKQNLEGALAIFRGLPGTGDLGSSWCLNDLGLLCVDQGDLAGAVPFYQEALRLKEKAIGPDDPDFANGLNSLGWTLMLIGEYSVARPLLERAAKVVEKRFGPEHAANGMYLHSLGECLRRMGESTEARAILERAVYLCDRPNDEGLVNYWSGTDAHLSLATLYSDLGQDARAEFHFRRAIGIAEKTDFPNRFLPGCLDGYADFLDRGGRGSEASKLRARARELRPSTPEPKPGLTP
jgi:serine/threonine protein kinase/Tfp pilus assembly protein PilF